MKEAKQQLQASTDSAAVMTKDSGQETSDVVQGGEPFGSFVALRRLSKVQVEAVRMQGCADGAGDCQ